MKLPSLQSLISGFLGVARRFPLELASASVGTVCAMALFEQVYSETNEQIILLLLCSILALALFLSLTAFTEARQWPVNGKLGIKAAGLAFMVIIFISLDPITDDTNIFRFSFLAVAFHLLVSFSPYIYRGSMDGFWEYNMRLFIRILTAGLYSAVLYTGLAVALLSADALFDFKIRSEIYGHLFALVFGLFNTTFFLAGFPDDWKGMEDPQPYPKGLKIFTQYVLIPLATVYLGIMLAYEGKLMVEWSLPRGLVATLVLGYAVYGMLSILLVHPVRFDPGNRWIMTFSRFFYLLLIPLIILLGIAVYLRVNQYGVTESRYVIIVLSLWLTGITIYFLTSRLQNIKVIPISLCMVALMAVWGPQSASSVSLRSQAKRLVTYFEQHHAVVNGKLVPLADGTGSGEATELLRYIVSRHGPASLQKHLTINADSLTRSADTLKYQYAREYERLELVRRYLNLQYSYESTDSVQYYGAEALLTDSVSISGYRYLIQVQFPVHYTDRPYSWDVNETTFTFNQKSQQSTFNLQPVVDRVTKESNDKVRYLKLAGGELFCMDETTGNRLLIENINFQLNGGRPEIQGFTGILLIR